MVSKGIFLFLNHRKSGKHQQGVGAGAGRSFPVQAKKAELESQKWSEKSVALIGYLHENIAWILKFKLPSIPLEICQFYSRSVLIPLKAACDSSPV